MWLFESSTTFYPTHPFFSLFEPVTGPRIVVAMSKPICAALLLLVWPPALLQVDAWSNQAKADVTTVSHATRRNFLMNQSRAAILGASISSASIAVPWPSIALDMESFVQKELAEESCDDRVNKKCKPKLSDDEALCRFGQPSPKTGEACLRAGMPTKRPSGVDAFGNLDRGDYVRCKAKYVDDPKTDKLVKTWNCQ